MKYAPWIFLSIFIVIVLVLVKINITTPTGAVVEESPTYATTLDHLAQEFFGVSGILFPRQGCGDIANGLYADIAFTPIDEIAGFETSGPNSASTVNFVIDRVRRLGTFDMIKGSTLVNQGADGMISVNAEAIVRIPKDLRNTFFNMDLYGTSDRVFMVKRGRFSIPSMDCEFTVANGIAICDCKIHSIRDLSIAGIPVPITVVERGGARWQGQGP